MITFNLNTKISKILLSMIFIVLGISLTYLYSSLLLVFLIAYFFAFMFEPLIRFLEKKKIGRTLSVVVIWGLMSTVLILIIFPLIFSILTELTELQPKISQYTEKLSVAVKDIRAELNSKGSLEMKSTEKMDTNKIFLMKIVSVMEYFNVSEQNIIDFFIGAFNKIINSTGKFLRDNISGIISRVVWIITIPIISFYFMLDFSEITQNIKKLEFSGKRKFQYVFMEIEKQISRFFRGQVVICFFIGLLMGTGFFLIGVDFPHILGVVAGVANLIPYFGVLVSTTLAIIFFLLKYGFTSVFFYGVVKILILVGIVQAIDGFFISPKILSSTLELSPIYIMFFLIAGGMYGGILGMFLAIPVLIVVKVIIKNIRIRFN